MKHTQGEWEYTPHMNETYGCKAITVDDNTKYHRRIAIANISEHPQRPEESEANARLIAAAPDLLKALKELTDIIQYELPISSDKKLFGIYKAHQYGLLVIKKATAENTNELHPLFQNIAKSFFH